MGSPKAVLLGQWLVRRLLTHTHTAAEASVATSPDPSSVGKGAGRTGEGEGRELVSASGKPCWGSSVVRYVGGLCSLKALVSLAVKAAGVFCRTGCLEPALHGFPSPLHGSHCMCDSVSLCSSSLFLAVSSCLRLP